MLAWRKLCFLKEFFFSLWSGKSLRPMHSLGYTHGHLTVFLHLWVFLEDVPLGEDEECKQVAELFHMNWYAAQIYKPQVNNHYFFRWESYTILSRLEYFLQGSNYWFLPFFPLSINTSHHSYHASVTKTALHCLSQTLIFLNVRGTDEWSLHLIKSIKWTHVKKHILCSNN